MALFVKSVCFFFFLQGPVLTLSVL